MKISKVAADALVTITVVLLDAFTSSGVKNAIINAIKDTVKKA